jgi:ankyrin repeat protein
LWKMKYEKKFFSAAREGDLKTIEKALADGFPVDHLSELKVNRDSLSVTPGRTGLMWAAIEGQKEVVAALLTAGASPDVREHTGLEAFADDEDRFRDTWVLAAEYNQPEIMELLLRTVKRPTGQRLTDCLEHAAGHGSLEVVKLLLDEGIDIDGTSIDGTTPLMAAARHGRADVVEYLLIEDATVNLSGPKEIGTALNQCAFSLMFRNVTLDAEGNEIEDPPTEQKLACLKLLLGAGANPNVEQAVLGYPLEQVAGNREAAQMLLEAGANPRLTGSMQLPRYDGSPDAGARERLMAAIEAGDPHAVSEVLSDGADIDEEDEDGHTPIMYAAYLGNMNVVKLLVENGADLNRWGQGDNVLNRAAAGGHREVYE